MSLFDMNGPLMNALRKLANIILCNITFCLLSLPLFTVGGISGGIVYLHAGDTDG